MICGTTIHSPTYSEIMIAAEKASKPNFCLQNLPGFDCKQLASYKGGQIWLCGKFGLGVDCEWVMPAAWSLILQCGKPSIGRASGWIIFSDKLYLVVI
jgi:hypothetical protein